MKAITVRQPWASLITAGVKTIETHPRPTSYRGRIAIHAGKTKADPREPAWAPLLEPNGARIAFPYRPLPLGAVAGSAVLTDCLPIYASGGFATLRETPRYVYRSEVNTLWIEQRGHLSPPCDNITDQLPFGDFTPGRWALLLDDAKPTTERCPWCWGTLGDPERMDEAWYYHGIAEPGSIPPCPVCVGDDGFPTGRCDPVPARGPSGLWEWTP